MGRERVLGLVDGKQSRSPEAAGRWLKPAWVSAAMHTVETRGRFLSPGRKQGTQACLFARRTVACMHGLNAKVVLVFRPPAFAFVSFEHYEDARDAVDGRGECERGCLEML